MKIILKDKQLLQKHLMTSGHNISSFSQFAEISRPTVSNVFNGKINPSPVIAKRIVDCLGIEFDEVFKIQ